MNNVKLNFRDYIDIESFNIFGVKDQQNTEIINI